MSDTWVDADGAAWPTTGHWCAGCGLPLIPVDGSTTHPACADADADVTPDAPPAHAITPATYCCRCQTPVIPARRAIENGWSTICAACDAAEPADNHAELDAILRRLRADKRRAGRTTP